MSEGTWVGLDVLARKVVAGVLDAASGEVRMRFFADHHAWRMMATLRRRSAVPSATFVAPLISRYLYCSGPGPKSIRRIPCAAATFMSSIMLRTPGE